MLGHPGISPVNRLNPLRVLGTIRGRRGDASGWELLDEALALAEGTGEPQWIVPVRAARAELHWLSGDPGRGLREARSGYELGARATSTRGRSGRWPSGWPGRASPSTCHRTCPEPYALELAGDWAAAALAWEQARPPVRRRPGLAGLSRRGGLCGRRWHASMTSAPGPPRPRPGGG